MKVYQYYPSPVIESYGVAVPYNKWQLVTYSLNCWLLALVPSLYGAETTRSDILGWYVL